MITILADDITGAAEVAGVCLRYGLSVHFGIQTVPEGEADVRVIATDSRSLPAEEAVRLHASLAAAIGKTAAENVFKKTDSVLRGHVLAELKAWNDVLGFPSVVFEPANPDLGRTVNNGRYFVEGKPLNETAFRNDPDFPAHTNTIETLLSERDTTNTRATLLTGRPKPVFEGILIPDCSDASDLRMAVAEGPVLHAGSAAFLAAWLEKKHNAVVQPAAETVPLLQGRYLMVCGSKHANSAEFQASSRKKGLAVVEFPVELLQESLREPLLDDWADQLADFWAQTGQMLLCFGKYSADFPHSGAVLGNRMARVVRRIVEAGFNGELLLEGGATAYALLETVGWKMLRPLQELAPGVVRMAVVKHSDTFVTLKPGSYAWPESSSESSNLAENDYLHSLK